MAVRKLDTHPTPATRRVTVKSDPTRIDPLKLKLGKLTARHDPRGRKAALFTSAASPIHRSALSHRPRNPAASTGRAAQQAFSAAQDSPAKQVC